MKKLLLLTAICLWGVSMEALSSVRFCAGVARMQNGNSLQLGDNIHMRMPDGMHTPNYTISGSGSFYSGLLNSSDWQDALYCWDWGTVSPQIIKFEGEIHDVPEDLFNHLGTIHTVTFSSAMAYINNRAFKNIGISTLTFPGRVGWVGIESFAGCVNLKTVTFQNGVENIYDRAFKWCTALDDIYIYGSQVPALHGGTGESSAFYEAHHAITFHVPYAMLQAYHDANVWKDNIANQWLVHRLVSIEDGLTLAEYRAVTGVSLNRNSMTLGVRGSTGQLTATISRATAVNKNVTWSSSNPAVATVTAAGLVTAVSRGTANITVRTAEGGFTATCAVTVSGNTDASLRSLTAAVTATGTSVPLTLVSGTYTGSVPGSVSSITVIAVRNDTTAAVTGAGTKTLTGGDNSFTVTVTAENGTAVNYPVKVRRLSADATLQSLAVSSGTLSPQFNAGTLNYTDTVSSATGSITITAAGTSGFATVTGGNVTRTVNVGDTAFTVSVRSEDGTATKDYTIRIHRKSTDATLKSLSVSSGTLSPLFNANTFIYYDTVPSATDSIMITAAGASGFATVTGNNVPHPIEVGDNTLTVTVRPEEGPEVNNYTIRIHRQSGDATLQDVKVNGKNIPLDNLNDSVPFDTELIQIQHTAHPKAKVTVTRPASLTVGNNTFNITVTAEDPDSTRAYTLTVRRRSNDTTLQSLHVNGISLPLPSPYNSIIYDTVSYPVASVSIVPAATHEYATVEGIDDSEYELQPGENRDIPFTVTAEDNTYSKIYTLKVRRLNNNAKLGTFRAGENRLSPKFHSDTPNYAFNVENDVDQIDIEAIPEDGNARVTVTRPESPRSLNVGNNTFNITVTAEDPDSTRTYTLMARRLSNDATLSTLTVNGSPVQLIPNVFEYGVDVEDGVSYATVDCRTNWPAATATVSPAGDRILQYGENVFSVTVKAEDYETKGTTETYTITVSRISNDATLKYLTVAPGELKFSPDTTQYAVNVPYTVSSITIDFEVTDPQSVLWTGPGLEQPGIKQLNVGENVFGIGVYAGNKKYYKSYWVRITREAPPAPPPGPTGFYEAGAPAAVQVYTANGNLYINSPAAERINVYSVAGTLLYSFDKPAGEAGKPRPPSQVLIVKGSSGWVRKTVIND